MLGVHGFHDVHQQEALSKLETESSQDAGHLWLARNQANGDVVKGSDDGGERERATISSALAATRPEPDHDGAHTAATSRPLRLTGYGTCRT